MQHVREQVQVDNIFQTKPPKNLAILALSRDTIPLSCPGAGAVMQRSVSDLKNKFQKMACQLIYKVIQVQL
jgi:hypothetical protein